MSLAKIRKISVYSVMLTAQNQTNRRRSQRARSCSMTRSNSVTAGEAGATGTDIVVDIGRDCSGNSSQPTLPFGAGSGSKPPRQSANLGPKFVDPTSPATKKYTG